MAAHIDEAGVGASDSPWSVEGIRDYLKDTQIGGQFDKEVQQVFNETWDAYVHSASPPETLYHYTSAPAMRSILLSSPESRYLRAGDLSKTNDPTETIDQFVSLLGAQRRDLIEDTWARIWTHVACFSPDPEMLSQWNKYAKQCTGCAIGFSPSRLQEWFWSQAPPLAIFPMNYDRNRHDEMCLFFGRKVRQLYRRVLPQPAYESPALNSFLSSEPATEWLFMRQLSLKAGGWQGEREWRIRAVGRRSESSKPFTELSICTPGLVTEVILGSRFDGEAAALERELREAGLEAVRVNRSSCGL